MNFLDNINNYKADSSGWIGSGIMLIFALIAGFRWYNSGIIFFALLIIRDLAASWFLITRKPNKGEKTPRSIEVLAYLSSSCPFIYLESSHSLPNADLISSILAIIGFTLSTLALVDLGSSFGVAPANRGVIRTGLYRCIEHPMYSGYAISEFGFFFLNPFNFFIWMLSSCLYILRAKKENYVLREAMFSVG